MISAVRCAGSQYVAIVAPRMLSSARCSTASGTSITTSVAATTLLATSLTTLFSFSTRGLGRAALASICAATPPTLRGVLDLIRLDLQTALPWFVCLWIVGEGEGVDPGEGCGEVVDALDTRFRCGLKSH